MIVVISLVSMATPTNSFFLLPLLLFFSMFSTTTAQQTGRNSNNTIIPIYSFLTPTNINTNSSSFWLSRSGRFAFGFYQQDGGFVVGIWFVGIPQKTVVWTALILVNQTDSNNFRLRLTRDQGLVLQSTQGQEAQDQDRRISEFTFGSAVSYASMLDTGNMVLYNFNSTVIWQSFDFPTDTILHGQRLRAGGILFSKASETDYSKGRFELNMQLDGNLVAYPTERRPREGGYAYWNTGTFTAGGNVTVNLDEDGRLYLVNTNGTDIMNVSLSDNKAPNETIFYRLSIDINGIPSLYSYNLQDKNSNWSVKWTTPIDKCTPKGLCGINGYCILMDMDQQTDCLCLPGFDFIDSRRQFLGCERVVRLESCGSEELEQRQDTMNTITGTTWKEGTYSIFTSTTEEECKAACLKECNCEVVMFENKSCGKQKLPLRYGRRILGGTVTTFIKVSTKNTTTTSTTPTTREGPGGMMKKRKRSKKELKWSILIAGVSFISGFLLVIAISGFVVVSIGFRRVIGFYP